MRSARDNDINADMNIVFLVRMGPTARWSVETTAARQRGLPPDVVPFFALTSGEEPNEKTTL